jgi:hypothetical protein
MSEDKRRDIRHPLCVDVKVSHAMIGEKIVKTKNISDSGLFILVEPTEMPPVGEIIKGQIQGMPDAPIVDMEIVRTCDDGMGLRFLT